REDGHPMASGLWGTKIGMTQVFVGDKVVPVTAINVAHWFVTALRTEERDGYNAIQVGRVRKRYQSERFSKEWLQNPKQYFGFLREIKLKDKRSDITLGQPADFLNVLSEGLLVDVVGITK